MTRSDNVLNMQITIANCMKQEGNLDFSKVSELLEKYDLLSYIDVCYEAYNSMGIKGILQDKESKLYAESPEYVWSMLSDENNGNMESWIKY
ncbi:MAG: DUF3791 domain-containing protein [Blautia sp.]|nr:DUF3791 domain-containing protein [Lachnoclostridium sp.]MCM1211172.1 DUF3791 domain-containing protein [Blautia sp.]